MTGFLAWLRGGRPFPYPRHTAGSAMAMFYFVGGLTILLILLLPHPATLHIGVMLVIGGVSPLLGLAILRLRFRLATSAYPWLLVVGTGIVTVLMATAGSRSDSGSFSFFYTWIVIYALLFFSPVSAAAQVGVAAAAYLTVWVSLDPSETNIGVHAGAGHSGFRHRHDRPGREDAVTRPRGQRDRLADGRRQSPRTGPATGLRGGRDDGSPTDPCRRHD